ncbi:saccharopine dehydrogenase family protein [Jeotgalibacillus proteolyticus]|uniref:saccharopine dehydrogenase family protein n=1 Tax=Jeotgalibacillus proteolyticus TaxID=2082395 RepID=UPI003CE9E710
MKKTWMIYGASGYTGELIARLAVKNGHTPILAGRRRETFHALAEELNLETRVFSLDDPKLIKEHLTGIDLVLHCAGPFQSTSAPMIEGCLLSATHYLDITGEVEVFEHTHAIKQSQRAAKAGVILCSGVGFDVIPTDCTALKLKELLPDATQLSLGFDSDSGISPGTVKTMIRGLSSGSLERKDTEIQAFPLGKKKRTIEFGRGKKTAIAIPWGDVSTAYHTTGIPSITTWIPMPSSNIRAARIMSFFGPFLGTRPVQNGLLHLVDKRVSGPDENSRDTSPAYIWGEARNDSGEQYTVRIQTPNVYSLTASGALEVASRILGQANPAGGSFTPAGLFGSKLIEELPGCGSFEVEHEKLN